ncbi:zinc finger protein 845-like [Aricia agestis]|uniref:zinc finger protein 845-like n=1 Tax=Aricia agestis TaxID=91739 RepID=UPI001C205573|nr:zinc finger protein 845-like [Aricia agestis]XP_041970183.1 zinc finger protein 845-like [Aricia agestis]
MSDEESMDEPLRQSEDRTENPTDILKPTAVGSNEPNDGLDDLMVELDSDEASANEKDMMSMFASVWVKVEVEEDSNTNMAINLNSCKTEPSDRSLRARPNAGTTKYRFDDDDVNIKSSGKKKPNKVLKCDQCEYTTGYKNCLNMHILSHHTDDRPYACHYCGYTTKYPTSLSRHILIQHELKDMPQDGQENVYKCDNCDYTSQFKWNLNAHKRKHKLVKQFKCPQCDYCTAYRHNFMKHSKVHTEGIFFKCDKCPFVTRFEGHITRHLAKIHNVVSEKASRCDLCDFSTKVRWRLNTHKQRSKQEKALHCPYCDFVTFYMCESKKHKATHYNKIYGTPASHKVQQNSLTPTITNPIDKLEPQSQPPTPICREMEPPTSSHSKKRGSNQNYKLDPDCLDWNSIQVIESDDREKPFLCHMCSYTSKFKAAVQRHFQRHHTGTTNKPYKCCNCEFSTKTKDQIALHNKRSISEHLMVCKTCGFTTNYKCQYVSHQKRVHYEFKCMTCSYTCRQKYELQKHYATMHLGNGLKCKYCDYTSARKESLLCHETIHTGDKPFKCTLCPYMSIRRSLLENHIKRYHSEQTKDVTIISDDKIESLKVSLPPETFASGLACESK